MPTLNEQKTIQHRQLQAMSNRTPKILCVDDDPDFQTTIELRMRQFDVVVDHAYYGMQGIVEAAQSSPDLILMDQAMPHGNGEYLLEATKRNSATSHIPVIVLTGMRDPKLKQRLMQAGAAVFLNKPVSFDELLHHIGRFIDLRTRDFEGELQ